MMVIDVNGYTPALACAPSAPVADCLSMIVHIMIDSLQNGRRSGSLNLSSLNVGKSVFKMFHLLIQLKKHLRGYKQTSLVLFCVI